MDQAVCLAEQLQAAAVLAPVERLSALAGVQERLNTLIAVETAGFDGQAPFEGRGYRSPASFLVESKHVSGRTARTYLNVGRRLKQFPLLADAAAAGEVSFDHLRAFARIVASPRASDERIVAAQSSEASFVAKAKAYSADDFSKLCKQWRSIFDEDCPNAQARIADKTDVTYIQHDDDIAELRIVGPTIDVQTVRTAYTRLADRMWRKENSGADNNVKPMRHNGLRKFDAVVELARRAMANEGKDMIEPEPLTTIVMDWDTFNRGVAELAADTPPSPDAVFADGFTSETSDGTPIGTRQAIIRASLGRIRRIVFGNNSTKTDLGRSSRVYTGSARTVVATRDKHCQAPGCDMPARWCDVDHITQWQHGGQTNPENGQLLCRFHHTRKHQGDPAA